MHDEKKNAGPTGVPERFRILVAEDEAITRKHLLLALQNEGYDAEGAANGLEALAKAETESYDLIIADIKMPGLNGIELLDRVRGKHPGTEFMIITGYPSVGSAVETMKKGTVEYITKPFKLDHVLLKIKKLHDRNVLKKDNVALKTFFGMKKQVFIVAQDPKMKKILEMVEGIKNSSCNVLLTGESGVGKNLLAKIIHFTSLRSEDAFLSINCATLTEELLASELFGHEKGSFTGAIRAKHGLVENADRGTLFLDEIAEISPSLQAKLLKVIEDGEFYRVGGTTPLRVDVRFIASTNQQVRKCIMEGRFREDLYYRLNVMEISIPPLRERKEDIEPLCYFFLEKHLPRSNKKISGFADETLKILKSYTFPGNVRELENLIERAIILEKSALITPDSLPQSMTMYQIETIEPDRIRTIDELNRDYAEKIVRLLGGNRSKAAELLGISRTSLWRMLKESPEKK
jgi:DNA-binding NtrC family response regulator